MTVLPIAMVGDPVLRERAAEVSSDELRSAQIQQLIDDLIETRRAAGGAGLAAPQVSVSKRIAVVEVDGATRYKYKPLFPLTVIVNPTIERLSAETLTINEGCLSVPDLRGEVARHVEISMNYFDRNGAECRIVARGLTAGTFQHELDHLDGILFLDRVTDPTTFSTWAEFARYREARWLASVAPWVRSQ
jgi:peptide deformylase